jgi:hypothetical protein
MSSKHQGERNKYTTGFLLFLVSCFLILSWCSFSTSSSWVETEVAGFLLQIPKDATAVNPALVENKQIVDKVIKAWKIDKTQGFDPTLIFTKSSIGPEVDYEQFYTVNQKKFEQYIPGYSKGEREIISFSCGDAKVKWFWVSFGVKSWFLDDETMYYFGQYQFVHAGSGFVLSYASDSIKERDGMKAMMTDVACK